MEAFEQIVARVFDLGRHRADEADEEGAIGELERQPSFRHRLHPRADQRHRLPDQEDPEVPMSEEDAKRVDGRRDGGGDGGGEGHGKMRESSPGGTPRRRRVSLRRRAPMRFHTYTKFSPEMADAVDLQSLLDKLADFLLQSGFAGGDRPVRTTVRRLRRAATARSTRSSRRSSTR